MSPQATFCIKCGSPLDPAAHFCTKCGTPRADVGQADEAADFGAPVTAGSGGGPTFAANPAAIARQVASAAGMATSMAGAVSLPWQTIVAGETPDIQKLVVAGAPIAQGAVRASLRRPAIALLVTTLLDVAVALVSGQPAALKLVGLRAAMGVGTAVLGMVVGSKAGRLRQLTGFASALTGLVQTGSILFMMFSRASSPTGWLGLVPSLVTQLSALAMMVKTAVVSLKRPDRPRPDRVPRAEST
jgi:hypothetical protein